MADIVTKDMPIMQVIQKYPETIAVFMEHGLGCIGCALAHYENIEQGAAAHGMDIDALMKDLNDVASKHETRKK